MSDPIHEYYSESPGSGHFHKVIALHEKTGIEWEVLSKDIPLLPRGWFELSRLPLEDRLEFTKGYWFAKLPFLASDGMNLEERLEIFFEHVEEIAIFATQTSPQQPFDVHMVYGLKEGQGFFHGSPPANKESIATLVKQFAEFILPHDYLAFLEIHDGFCKYTDTGLIKMREMARIFMKFQELLEDAILIGPDGEQINPSHLIPFYESSQLHCYQCFYADWYPREEMGNVHYSEIERAMSNFADERRWEESQAFPTFMRWLVNYLEDY